jgi:hypothetical protein
VEEIIKIKEQEQNLHAIHPKREADQGGITANAFIFAHWTSKKLVLICYLKI